MRKWLEGFPRGQGPRGISHVSTVAGWPVMTLLRGKIVAEEQDHFGKRRMASSLKGGFPLTRGRRGHCPNRSQRQDEIPVSIRALRC